MYRVAWRSYSGMGAHQRSQYEGSCRLCKLPQGLSGSGVVSPSVHGDVGHAAMLDVEELVEAPGGEARFHLSPSATALDGLAG